MRIVGSGKGKDCGSFAGAGCNRLTANLIWRPFEFGFSIELKFACRREARVCTHFFPIGSGRKMRRLATVLTFLLVGGVLPRCGVNENYLSKLPETAGTLWLLVNLPRVAPRDQRSHRYLFVTATGHNGNFGGVSGADAVCNASVPAALAGSSNYKALLVDGAARIATATGDLGDGQADWVLEANREYRRADGLSVFTTNAVRLFSFDVFGSGATLSNPVSVSAGSFWTGLSVDWTYMGAAIACNGWTSASAGVSGEVGAGDQTGLAAIHEGAETCNRTTRSVGGAPIGLLCIEQ